MPAIAKYYWDFRDELSTDEGLLLKGPSLVIPAVLRESYLHCLHKADITDYMRRCQVCIKRSRPARGHLSESKVKSNTKQHMFWPGMEADITDYMRRCQMCIKRSRPAREPL